MLSGRCEVVVCIVVHLVVVEGQWTMSEMCLSEYC